MSLSRATGLLVLVAGAFLSGLYVGRSIRPTPPPHTPEIRHEAPPSIRDFTSTELEEYAQLKLARAKYEKADELLGKMILLLVADLGLRVSDSTQRFAEFASQRAPEPTATPEQRVERFIPSSVAPEPSPDPNQPTVAMIDIEPGPSARIFGTTPAQAIRDKILPLGHVLYWSEDDENSPDYRVRIQMTDGQPVAVLESTRDNPSGTSRIFYQLDPRVAQGKRMVFEAELRGEQLDRGDLAIRVRGRGNRQLDYRQVRVAQTPGWKKARIALDVPVTARAVKFTLTLNGRRKLEMRNVSLRFR